MMTSDRPLSYWIAVARMGFQDDFNRLFEELGISQAELARRLPSHPGRPVSEAYVSKFLNGTAGNYELKTMAKWARAVGGVVQVRVIKEDGEVVRVVDYETARTWDEKQATPAPESLSTNDKVVNLSDYRKERFEKVEVRVTSQGEQTYG
jgi:transcriptional regulator with XRE-family HTH domain